MNSIKDDDFYDLSENHGLGPQSFRSGRFSKWCSRASKDHRIWDPDWLRARLKIRADWDAEYGSALYKSFVQTRLNQNKNNGRKSWSRFFGTWWYSNRVRPMGPQGLGLKYQNDLKLLYNNNEFITKSAISMPIVIWMHFDARKG